MKPATHEFVANFDIGIGVANVTARRSASARICHFVEYKHFLSFLVLFNHRNRCGCLLKSS